MALMSLTNLLVGLLVTLGASTSTAIDGDGSCKTGGACENNMPKQEDISALFQSKNAQVLTGRVLPNLVAGQSEASTRPRMQKLMEIHATVHDIKELIGAGSTPEVPGLIQSLIDIIKTEIQVKVKGEQTNAQAELDTRLDVLKTRTETAVGLKAGSDQVDKSHDTCVTEEQQVLVAYETCKAEEAALIDDKPTAAFCGNPDFDIAYSNPPQLAPILNVDFSKGLEFVHGELDIYLQPLRSFIDSTKVQAAVDQKKWDAADKKCKGIIDDIDDKTTECGQRLAVWRAQHEKCGNEKGGQELSLCQFGDAYQNKCVAKTAFDTLKDDIVGSGTVWSEPDRENEWTQTTKLICVLEKFKTDTDLSTDAVNDCTKPETDAAAQFTKDVTRIDTKQSTYDSLTSEESFTCGETHLTFGTGVLWTVPVNEAAIIEWIPSSASYTKATAHSYAIESDSSQPPFDFCKGTP